MAEDICSALARLLSSGQVETATVTVVLKPLTAPPPPTADTTCVFKIGPVSVKE